MPTKAKDWFVLPSLGLGTRGQGSGIRVQGLGD